MCTCKRNTQTTWEQNKIANCKQTRRLRTQALNSLALDLQPPKLGENTFPLINSRSLVLLWQRQLSNVMLALFSPRPWLALESSQSNLHCHQKSCCKSRFVLLLLFCFHFLKPLWNSKSSFFKVYLYFLRIKWDNLGKAENISLDLTPPPPYTQEQVFLHYCCCCF